MVHVLSLDSIYIFVCGEKVVDIDCSHLLLRDKLSDKRSNTMHKDLAKEHGANVLQAANKDIVDRYGEAFLG
jgi:spore coat polysaccharide biosynthesis protein SpsF (cytidylyltransferase family)